MSEQTVEHADTDVVWESAFPYERGWRCKECGRPSTMMFAPYPVPDDLLCRRCAAVERGLV